MKLPSLQNILFSPVSFIGWIFVSLNLYFSYILYHVNSYKILWLCGGITILVLVDLFRNQSLPKHLSISKYWKTLFILLIPLIATLPGIALYSGKYNFYFPIEFTSNLLVLLWIGYLFRNTKNTTHIETLIFLLSLSVIYASGWAFLEKAGLYLDPVDRVKSTHGNINYFAGFLIILNPLFLIFSFPQKIEKDPSQYKLSFSKVNFYYFATFLIGNIALLLTQTRAALAAALLAYSIVILLSIIFIFSKNTKKLVIIIGTVIVIGFITTIAVLFIFQDVPQIKRILSIFTYDAWKARIIPWEAAVASIKNAPLMGYGLGSSYTLFFEYVKNSSRLLVGERSFNHAHSELLEFLQEAGIIGLICFLFVWGFIFWTLFRSIQNKKLSVTLRLVAIGCFGGFIAYHFQSLFSVAPRMLVVKLPLYTLIALTFIIYWIGVKENTEDTTEESKIPSTRLKIAIPNLLILCVVYFLFAPWANSMFEKIQITKSSTRRYSLLQKLEKQAQKGFAAKNVYTLNELALLQLSYNQPTITDTFHKIDQQIPYFRNVPFLKAIYAYKQKNYPQSLKLALAAQKRDLYQSKNIHLLAILAIRFKKSDLFLNQVGLITKKLYINNFTANISDRKEVRFKIVKKGKPFEIVEKKNEAFVSWNGDFLNYIISHLSQIAREESLSQQQRALFFKYLEDHFSQANFFQLETKKKISAQIAQQVSLALKKYNQLNSQQQFESRRLNATYRKKKQFTYPLKRKLLDQELAKKQILLAEKYKEQTTPFIKTLEANTDWSVYLKRKAFLYSLITSIGRWGFPI
ncbi:MAG: O-antigen ligase [bacterium]|jgi:O-antigen ligase